MPYLSKTEVFDVFADMVRAITGPQHTAEGKALQAAIRDGAAFELQTKAGTLRGQAFAPTQLSARRWSHGWLALQFEDVQRAALTLPHDQRLNTHSGKWNWMTTYSTEPAALECELEKLRAEFLKLS